MFFEAEQRGTLFQMKVFCAAIDSVKFSSESELSSRFFGRLKFLVRELFVQFSCSFQRFCAFLEKKVWVVAIVFVKKSSKSELSSRFFGRLKIFQGLEGRLETSEVPIWRSCEFLSVTMTFVSKSYPRCPKIQLSMTFGGGVKVVQTIFFLTFGPKLTCTFLVR